MTLLQLRHPRSLVLFALTAASVLTAPAFAEIGADDEIISEIVVEIDDDGDASHSITDARGLLVSNSQGQLRVELEYDATNVSAEARWGHGVAIAVVENGATLASLSGVHEGDLESGQQATFSRALSGIAVDLFLDGNATLLVSPWATDFTAGVAKGYKKCSAQQPRSSCEAQVQQGWTQAACEQSCRLRASLGGTASYCAGVSCGCVAYKDDDGNRCESCSMHFQCTDQPSQGTIGLELPEIFTWPGGPLVMQPLP